MQANIADHFWNGLRRFSSLSSLKCGSIHPHFRTLPEFPCFVFNRSFALDRCREKNLFPKVVSQSECTDRNFSRSYSDRVFRQHENCFSDRPIRVPQRYASTGTGSGKPDNLPNQDILNKVRDTMIMQVSQIFTERHEYRMYTKDIVLENDWNLAEPYTITGIGAYVMKVLKLRVYMNIKYARVKVEVLSSSVHEDLGCVCVRWRIGGLPQHKAFMFWKFMPFKIKKTANNQLEWLDGLSTFFVGQRGHIYKHRIDRVIPDREGSEGKQEKKSDMEGVGPAAV